MDSLLLMQDIEKSFGTVKALNHARLEVAEGEVHALIGANGAGKCSTLIEVKPSDSGNAYKAALLTAEGGNNRICRKSFHPM